MSHLWAIACIDCGESLLLGKLVSFGSDDLPVPASFGGTNRFPRERSLDLTESFLIGHAGHAIIVGPSDELDHYGSEEDPYFDYWLDDERARDARSHPPSEHDAVDRMRRTLDGRLTRRHDLPEDDGS